jgi:hypothetical protein
MLKPLRGIHLSVGLAMTHIAEPLNEERLRIIDMVGGEPSPPTRQIVVRTPTPLTAVTPLYLSARQGAVEDPPRLSPQGPL